MRTGIMGLKALQQLTTQLAPMRLQLGQRALFVSTHQATVARDIGRQNGRRAALYPLAGQGCLRNKSRAVYASGRPGQRERVTLIEVRRTVEQLADRQERMASDITKLQAVDADIRDKISSAPLRPAAAPASKPKPTLRAPTPLR